jgi:TPR repeat protein
METKNLQIDQKVEGSGNIFSTTGDVNVVQYIHPAGFADRRNLEILREKVKHFWIETVLDQSLHQVAAIELGKVIQKETVEHPWDLVIEHRRQIEKTISGQESIGILFDAFDQAILILGAPGAGKTITLLELAKDLITLSEKDPTKPIPVIFNLSTWSPQQGTLFAWLIAEMTSKYSVNRKLSKSWFENQWILPLLDGLDEVKEKYRSQCLNAINSFTQAVGVAGIAVCSRKAEYTRLPERLHANGAICLQPLNANQVDRYLLDCGPRLSALRTSIKNDPELMSLAQSPLMLNIMCLSYSEGDAITQPKGETCTGLDRRHLLIDTYITKMFERRGNKNAHHNRDQLLSMLCFLAKGMRHHSQNVFLAESLQPSWLLSNRQLWVYLVIAHVISGLLSVLLLIPLIYISRDQSVSLSYQIASRFFVFMTIIFSGVLAGALRFKLTRGIIAFNNSGSVGSIVINISIFWLILITLLGPVLVSIGLDELNSTKYLIHGWAYGLYIGLFWGLWGRKRTIHSDIKSFEGIDWSWKRATYGGLICGGFWLIYSVFYWYSYGWTKLDVEVTIDWQFVLQYILAYLIVMVLLSSIGMLYGGLSARREISHKTNFNQGMHQTLRNVILIMLAFIFYGLIFAGAIWFTFAVVAPDEIKPAAFNWIERLREGLKFGYLLGFFAVFVFGGHDLILHGVLRAILSRKGWVPIRCRRFFLDAAKLIFLQRVGGGFRFIHQSLQEHFSFMHHEMNFSAPTTHINRHYQLHNLAKISLIIGIYILTVNLTVNPLFRNRTAALFGDNTAIFALGEHYEKQKNEANLETAISWYRKAAENGNSDAQIKMGYAYLTGRGVEKDYQKAMQWYSLAADREIAHAQYVLGYLYFNGLGISPNIIMAEKFYRLAAEQGHSKAQMHLAWINSKEGCLPYNAEESMKWYHAAAENGLSDAQFTLGRIYHTDQHLSDYGKAEKWYRLAAAQGHATASGALGWLLIETERWDEAKLFTQKAHDSDPQDWAWIVNLGNLALLNGKRTEVPVSTVIVTQK